MISNSDDAGIWAHDASTTLGKTITAVISPEDVYQ